MTLEANSLFRQVQAPCRGKCKGDRGALDGPQRYGRNAKDQKGVYCTCCEQWLMRASKDDFARAIAEGRIAPGVAPTSATLLTCTNCQYDTVSMAGLAPA